MTDDVLAPILDGIAGQTLIDDATDETIHPLFSFVYSNNQIGPKSLERLPLIQGNLLDLKLNNVKFWDSDGGFQALGRFVDFFARAEHAPYLMKLTLSNIDLSSHEVVESLLELIEGKEYLQAINFSWANLSPKSLVALATGISGLESNLRQINLGYNRLRFRADVAGIDESLLCGPEYAEHLASVEFVDLIANLMQSGRILNHVDFSGMNFDRHHLLRICESFTKSNLLMSFHMSDNGISSDPALLLQILELFGLDKHDIPPQRRNFKDEVRATGKPAASRSGLNHQSLAGPTPVKRKRINIEQALRKYMTI